MPLRSHHESSPAFCSINPGGCCGAARASAAAVDPPVAARIHRSRAGRRAHNGSRRAMSPVARKLAAELNVDLARHVWRHRSRWPLVTRDGDIERAAQTGGALRPSAGAAC